MLFQNIFNNVSSTLNTDPSSATDVLQMDNQKSVDNSTLQSALSEYVSSKYSQCNVNKLYEAMNLAQSNKSQGYSYVHGYNYAQSNSSYASGYSNSFAGSYTSASNQPISQHMVDSSMEGTLYGIMEVKKLMFNIIVLPNGTAISVPFEETQYEFYIKTPVNLKKSLIYKIRPYVKERIMIEKKEVQVGYCAVLCMECIDHESELPLEFTYTANQTIPFKITNARQTLNDDTYRFYLDDIEIAFLHDSQEEAYMNFDISKVMYLFDKNDVFLDKYSDEYGKYNKRIAKRFSTANESNETIYRGTCVGDNEVDGRQFLSIDFYNPAIQQNQIKNISYKINAGNMGEDIVVNSAPIIYRNYIFKGRSVELLYGEALKGKDYYRLLCVGGEVLAIDRITDA